MLKIYYGRENVNKEKYMYDAIKHDGSPAIVIVPDQYTLEAEKQAFRFLGTESLIGVEIISMSRLGYKLLEELGGSKKEFIDKYGRHMILSRIVKEEADNIEVFKGTLAKGSFVELVNNFISEMKQYEVTPELLEIILDPVAENSLLKRKLKDLNLIYTKYEEAIAGKFTDSEDYINLYIDKIPDSKMIKKSKFWVYGFDSFAPKNLKVLEKILKTSDELNVCLTYDEGCRDEDLFTLGKLVMRNLEDCAADAGCKSTRIKLDADGSFDEKATGIKTLEQELYAIKKTTSENFDGVTLVQAANMYNEAESAASYVLHLLRDKGLRYKDIVVICNDQKVRGSILRRVFSEYGLEYFDDKKRGILNSQIVIFVISLLETVTYRYRTTDVFKLLKTGFTEFSDDDIETLENYSIKYRIKGTMWKNLFPKGEIEYGTEGLERINELRERVLSIFSPIEQLYQKCDTVSDFIEGFYDFLVEELGITTKILDFVELQRNSNLVDNADETAQIWTQICGIFDQIIQLSGDEKFDNVQVIDLLKAGLDQVQVGVLPPTTDDILVGTMQRTRAGQVKALLVVGANEGILPATPSDEALFTSEEMEFLAASGKGICKTDSIRNLEEQLAIYRNLSKPEQYLWISYSGSDEDGKEIRPSEIIELIKRIFPKISVQPDVLNRDTPEDLIGGRINTLKHLTENLQEKKKGNEISSMWKLVLDWFHEEDEELINKVLQGFLFTNEQVNLPVDSVEQLFKKDVEKPLLISPSRLERFSRCPFAHFISYGLRPEERRIYEAKGREIGDVYHSCLMELSERLTTEEKWDTITEEECRSLVKEITRNNAAKYGEGLFDYSNEEKYKTTRIEDVCFYVCWSLIEQVRSGSIESSQYEVPFGRGRDIDPIEIQLENQKVYIEGKIDRLDVLESDRVKIIDYKTGKEEFNVEEAKAGYRLQLLLYLKAAQENQRKPAGVFYFLISDPRIDITGYPLEKQNEEISKEMKKFFKLNGIMVGEDTVIEQIAGEFEGFSNIISVRKTKKGYVDTSKINRHIFTEDEFAELQRQVDTKVLELCRELTDGRIEIKPKKTKKSSPCDYCQFKGICRFDLGFSGCEYEMI